MSDFVQSGLAMRGHRTSSAEGPFALRTRAPIVYDLTHLIARLASNTATGIDRIDLAFATHFFTGPGSCEAVRYGWGPPRKIDRAWAVEFTRAAQRIWKHPQARRIEALWAWLDSEAEKPTFDFAQADAPDGRRRWLRWLGYFMGDPRGSVPKGAIYINVAYHRFEQPRFFAWLATRPDVCGVFMVHDLLPLDYPEYFEVGEVAKFRARIATALRYGRAFLVSTEAVRQRLQREIAAQGLPPRPIWARHFPSPLTDFAPTERRVVKRPYFVMVGTIEPRKNHLLILQIWRALARSAEMPPRLVIVGARGWENEQVLDMLDRCEALVPHVLEIQKLSSSELAQLIAGARALLAPSFDEGYGLPIVEALSLGTPVVASDCEAIREVAQGCARLLSPLDGIAWAAEIERLAMDDAYFARAQADAADFSPPSWSDYFKSLDAFIGSVCEPA